MDPRYDEPGFTISSAAGERHGVMKIRIEELEGNITKIVLEGRMDIDGSEAVDLRMNVVAGSSTRVLVDMASVTFLGSMGLRSIVLPAQAVKRRGGRMVLLQPIPMVEAVLKSANIPAMISIYHDPEAALAELRA
jgi:anti-anti-sigma factor